MGSDGYSPAEMPRREGEHKAARGEGPATLSAEPEPGSAAARRAEPGDTVWVCVSIVKADQREAFRRFIAEIKAPAVRAVNPGAHASVRLLEPTAPNADGTWSFVWLMDPTVPGEDYEMEPMFEEFYGHQKAVEHLRRWDDMHVGDQLFYEATQTATDLW